MLAREITEKRLRNVARTLQEHLEARTRYITELHHKLKGWRDLGRDIYDKASEDFFEGQSLVATSTEEMHLTLATMMGTSMAYEGVDRKHLEWLILELQMEFNAELRRMIDASVALSHFLMGYLKQQVEGAT